MVSGLVTSPDDQSRICLDDASPIRMASNSLMSINSYRSLSLFNFHVCQFFCERPGLRFGLLLRVFLRGDFHVGQVTELLVGGQRQLLARLVDALLSFLGLLGRRLPRGGAERARREVDAELLGGPQQL